MFVYLQTGYSDLNAKAVGVHYQFLYNNVKIKLNPGSEFGSGGEGKARLNFACTREVLEDALLRFKKGVELYKEKNK